jgi:inorganic phosphate transporter, PiT family
MDSILLIFGIALAYLFAFINGFHDGGNLIAANVMSKSIPPKKALYLACAGEFLGPFILGSAVADTLGRDVFGASSFNDMSALVSICAALASAVTWSLMTWWVGMPPGATHTLLGGLLGGFVAAFGLSGLNWSVALGKIFLALFMAPVMGFVASSLAASFFVPRFSVKEESYRKSQWISLLFLSVGHGANNAQKTTAVIVLMLLAYGSLKAFNIPFWTLLGAAGVLTAGVSVGAWKILKIFANKTFRIAPSHSLVGQGATGFMMLAANVLGCPVSATQIVKSSLVGSGAARRQKDLRKILVRDILIAWVVNLPASAFMAAALYWTAARVLGQGMGSLESIMKSIGQ